MSSMAVAPGSTPELIQPAMQAIRQASGYAQPKTKNLPSMQTFATLDPQVIEQSMNTIPIQQRPAWNTTPFVADPIWNQQPDFNFASSIPKFEQPFIAKNIASQPQSSSQMKRFWSSAYNPASSTNPLVTQARRSYGQNKAASAP